MENIDNIIAECLTILALARESRKDRRRAFETVRPMLHVEPVRSIEHGVCEDDQEATTYWALNRDTPHKAW